MKTVLSLMVGLATVVAASSVSQAQGAGGMAMQTETIEGVLVDTKCYGMMPEQNAGDDHMVDNNGTMAKVPDCAAICANLGIPVGLKTTDNRTIVLAAPANQLSKHMAQQVSLMGMYSKDKATFIVMRVVPRTGEAYDITTMM
jgi:hypothetical protein